MGRRSLHRLTALSIKAAKPGDFLPDGGGLYLQVTKGADEGARRSWVLRFVSPVTGKRREMGLGVFEDVGLADARDTAAAHRRDIQRGLDPIDQRDAEKAARAHAASKAKTFKEAGEAYLAGRESAWRNAKHKQQWENTLATYVYPKIGDLPVASIDVGHVLSVLDPIWTDKPETARRIRGRIEAILNWARVRNHRAGENPARWRGHLSETMARQPDIGKARHHAAMPFDEVPALMVKLRKVEGMGARALEFAILTAARTGEVIGAQWKEIDFDAGVWTVPAERMKANKEHRVPLSAKAVELLRTLQRGGDKQWIFPGEVRARRRKTRPLSNMAMTMAMRRLKANYTVHGFRSSFRDWVSERTHFQREIAEAALAHAIGDKVEAAYRRGDALEKRRVMMQAWADFCDTPKATGEVIALKRKAHLEQESA